MKRLLMIVSVILPLSPPAMAESVEVLAKKYAELPSVVLMMDDVLSPESMIDRFKASLPPGVKLSDEKLERIGAVMSGRFEVIRPRLKEAMVDGMIDNFSAPEIKAVIEFYSSEHGAAIMRKMAPFMEGVMIQIQPEMLNMLKDVDSEVKKIIRERE